MGYVYITRKRVSVEIKKANKWKGARKGLN